MAKAQKIEAVTLELNVEEYGALKNLLRSESWPESARAEAVLNRLYAALQDVYMPELVQE